MTTRADILRIVYDALADLNAQLPADRRVESRETTILIGQGSALDSLGVVELLVAIEERVASATGATVSLLEPLGQRLTSEPTDVATIVDVVLAQLG